jgi:hypothetical protein
MFNEIVRLQDAYKLYYSCCYACEKYTAIFKSEYLTSKDTGTSMKHQIPHQRGHYACP